MGNRAVVIFKRQPSVGMYLHWNGGRNSIEASLEALRQAKVRTPGSDPQYAFARMVQIWTNFFGGALSVGVGPTSKLDVECNNGVYVIDGNWEIVGRGHFKGDEQRNPCKEDLVENFLHRSRDLIGPE